MDNRNKWLLDNQGIAASIARSYAGICDFDDLFQEAMLGLMKGYDTYSLAKGRRHGAQLSTYAYRCAEQAVLDYVRNESSRLSHARAGRQAEKDNIKKWESSQYMEDSAETASVAEDPAYAEVELKYFLSFLPEEEVKQVLKELEEGKFSNETKKKIFPKIKAEYEALWNS